MITTDDPDLARRARELRNHGRNDRGEHVAVGMNHRMDEVSAAVGLEQLSHLADWNAGRADAAATYRDRLADLPDVGLPHERDDVEHVYHLFVIDVDDRDGLREHLSAAGVETGIHYETPVHRTQAVRQTLSDADASGTSAVPTLPRTERLVDRILSLPMHPRITEAEIDRVCDAIEGYYR